MTRTAHYNMGHSACTLCIVCCAIFTFKFNAEVVTGGTASSRRSCLLRRQVQHYADFQGHMWMAQNSFGALTCSKETHNDKLLRLQQARSLLPRVQAVFNQVTSACVAAAFSKAAHLAHPLCSNGEDTKGSSTFRHCICLKHKWNGYEREDTLHTSATVACKPVHCSGACMQALFAM